MNSTEQSEQVEPLRLLPTPVVRTVGVLSRVSPCLTSRVAAELFISPRNYRRSETQKACWEAGVPLQLHLGNKTLRGRRWGSGPAVLLVHGWSGCSAQFAGLVSTLVEKRFSVLAFDLPAHGASTGRQTTLAECIAAIHAIARLHGPFHGVIGHSFGALAAALSSLDQPIAEKLTLISPIVGANAALEKFGASLGIDTEVQKRMKSYFEDKIGKSFDELDLGYAACKLRVPTLIVHDRRDRIIPWSETARWAGWSEHVELFSTEGLGHYRILNDRKVAERIFRFFGKPQLDIRTALLSEYAL